MSNLSGYTGTNNTFRHRIVYKKFHARISECDERLHRKNGPIIKSLSTMQWRENSK